MPNFIQNMPSNFPQEPKPNPLETTKTILALYYRFENTCLIKASARKNQSVIIEDSRAYQDLAVTKVRGILEEFEKLPIWQNNNSSVRIHLNNSQNKCLKFSLDNNEQLETLQDLLRSVEKIKKIEYNPSVVRNMPYFYETLLIVLCALERDIVNPTTWHTSGNHAIAIDAYGNRVGTIYGSHSIGG